MSDGRDLRALHVGLATLAALNLSAGLWLALQGPAITDFEQVTNWAADWLRGGNPYAAIESRVDYPPWALVTLSPLALTPPALRLPLWIGLNLVLVAALTKRLAWHAGEPAPVRIALMLLLASTAAAHTLTQFSLLSYALAVAGVLSPSRFASAVAVGLALMKPQIGGIVLMWWLLSRQWSKAVLALIVPAVLTMVFALRSGADAGALLIDYVRVLAVVHGAADSLHGHTELRHWLERWPATGTLAFAAVLGAILLLPAFVASVRRRRWSTDEMLECLGLCGAASLLAVRHLSYDFIVLWPALIAWRTAPFAAGPRRYAPAAAFWVLAFVLVMGIPGWIRAAVAAGAPPALLSLTEIDRVVALGVWGCLAWRVMARRSGVNYW
jgi:hypothetical protein